MINRIYRMVLIGDYGVGKSATTIQYVQNHFVREYDPTIENSYRKQITVDDESYMLDILDTAGEEEYSVMIDQYIRSGEGFLFMFSLTSRISFDKLAEKILHAQNCKDKTHFPMILVGNKCDLKSDRQISTEEGEEMAKVLDCPYFETSAKERINIEESFVQLFREMKKYSEDSEPHHVVRK